MTPSPRKTDSLQEATCAIVSGTGTALGRGGFTLGFAAQRFIRGCDWFGVLEVRVALPLECRPSAQARASVGVPCPTVPLEQVGKV